MCTKSPPPDDGQPLSTTSSYTQINTKHTTKDMTEIQPIYRKDLMISICEIILMTESVTLGNNRFGKTESRTVCITQKDGWMQFGLKKTAL